MAAKSRLFLILWQRNSQWLSARHFRQRGVYAGHREEANVIPAKAGIQPDTRCAQELFPVLTT